VTLCDKLDFTNKYYESHAFEDDKHFRMGRDVKFL